MAATDRDRHPADADGDRIATERAQVQRLDRDALVETEVAQTAALAAVQDIPINREDARPHLLTVIAVGIGLFSVYCFARARHPVS